MTSTLRQSRFRIEGMDCASCAAKIDTAVRRLPGISDVAVSVATGRMTVTHAPESDLAALSARVAGLGYGVEPIETRRGAPAARRPPGDHARHDHGSCGGHAHDHGHDHRHGAGHRQAHDHAVPSAAAPDRQAPDGHDHAHAPSIGRWWQSRKGLTTIACGLALAAAYGVGKLVPALDHWAFLLALAVGLVPVARRAFAAALAGTPFSIEMLMTIAAVGAVIIGATEEAAAVVFLFLVGELLEGVAATRARASIQGLADLVPKTALVAVDGRTREVPAESLAVDTIILIRPGDRVPADGVVVAGDSAIDEAPVTGESTPRRRTVGDPVFAGTVNGDAALTVRVTAAAADNTIARVVKLVEEAQESKAPTERFIDSFSRYYTPAVLVVGALVAVVPPLIAGGAWTEWIYKGLAILLIGCPCALVISTPAAIAASLAAGARRGLLMKGGAVLERLGTLTTIAFDKTGTLTEGKPKVTDIVGFGTGEQAVLALAAGLETGSNHPLARAILARAEADGVSPAPAAGLAAIAGKGLAGTVEGRAVFLGAAAAAGERAVLPPEAATRIKALNDEGKTVSVLLVDGSPAGLIAMRDEPRADAREGLERLKQAGIRTLMLTGDNSRTAEAIARVVGIEPHGELLPEDKMRIVEELKRQGERVGKVGDGINDAPALAAADVGIAMGGAADVALETADAAVLHGRVADVAALVALSRRTMANIRQNITVALGLKAVFLVTTIAGVTGLWPAILADTGATVIVTANAMRLLRPS
ncbi:heavy metal translocating P-type ATPase [Phreatobacter sp. AB_2022a]|uniref:heavy metal translocating P-type ATPase n=1 Tax=Phreatobacter sp. AB_2022a TaxID=3003134 RepID=UPI00228702B8|nr:heavy metal translocating P-type ATPase [Phreatobacter sp. AB_2022a]MCZ0738744.1 heavy metal translocating P-type ATPase [Phreatobacter sp. AB_2022a]